MPLNAVATDDWQNAYTGQNAGAGGACSLVNAGNYVGNIGTIAQNQTWRVDRQNPPPGMTNVQIQRNGAQNPSSIACCIVPDDLAAEIGSVHGDGPQHDQARARFSELTRTIHSGLSQSVGSRRAAGNHGNQQEIRIFRVDGSFSA